MKRSLQFLRWLYGLSLNLFPAKYREEYGEELQAVFDLAIEEADTKGGLEVEMLVFREMVSLPKAILFEHLRAWRNARVTKGLDSYFDFAYGSWKEFLTALLPFFLTGAALPLLNYLVRLRLIPTAGPLSVGFRSAMQGLFIVLFLLFLVGLKTGIPRWSLPYAGFLSALLSVYFFSFLLGAPIYLLFRDFRDRGWLIMDILWGGIFWYGLLIAMILLVVASRISPTFQRFRNDWTQLCFILYGGVPFALWLTFDEYVGDEPYMLLAFLVLAVGAWFYLRSHSEWDRFGVLFIALTLAMFIAAAGKAILVPGQDWPITIDAGLAKSEARNTVIMWGWFALTMLVPLAIKLFPWSENPTQAA